MIPLRADLVERLRAVRGDADDAEAVVQGVPRVPTHRKYLAAAGIAWQDDAGRRADIRCLRHSFGTLLSKAGVSPREAMSLMRHTDLRLTMNVYTDPRAFDLSGAVERLALDLSGSPDSQAAKATGTHGSLGEPPGHAADAGWRESGTSGSAQIGGLRHASARLPTTSRARNPLCMTGTGNKKPRPA